MVLAENAREIAAQLGVDILNGWLNWWNESISPGLLSILHSKHGRTIDMPQ